MSHCFCWPLGEFRQDSAECLPSEDTAGDARDRYRYHRGARRSTLVVEMKRAFSKVGARDSTAGTCSGAGSGHRQAQIIARFIPPAVRERVRPQRRYFLAELETILRNG